MEGAYEAKRREIDEQFSYHAPREDQPDRYQRIRDAGKALAMSILLNTPRARTRARRSARCAKQ
jgi:hypothetical protein